MKILSPINTILAPPRGTEPIIDYLAFKIEGLLRYFSSLAPFWYIALVVAVLAVECLVIGYRESSIRRLLAPSSSARNDIALELIHIAGLARPITLIAALAIPSLVTYYHKQTIHFTLLEHVTNPFLAYLVWFLVVDFLSYWTHRWSHAFAPWWQLHKFHHAATEFNVITGNRLHFLDDALTEILRIVPLVLLGAPPTWFWSFWAIRVVVDLWQHSMIDWRYGWVGRWIIYSPVDHRIHHSAEPEHWDKNFGNIFVFWDRLFGTWYEGPRVNTTVGVSEGVHTGSVLGDLLIAIHRSWQELVVGIKTGRWRPGPKESRADTASLTIANAPLAEQISKEPH